MPVVLRADLGMGAVPACLIFVFYFFELDANRLTGLYGHESPNLFHAVTSFFSVVLLSKNFQFLQPFFIPGKLYFSICGVTSGTP